MIRGVFIALSLALPFVTLAVLLGPPGLSLGRGWPLTLSGIAVPLSLLVPRARAPFRGRAGRWRRVGLGPAVVAPLIVLADGALPLRESLWLLGGHAAYLAALALVLRGPETPGGFPLGSGTTESYSVITPSSAGGWGD